MPFSLQLLISFIAGGLFISLQTLIGERTKGFFRNAVLTLPSTMSLGLFFIGFIKSPQDVVEATTFIPAALAADFLFVMGFALFVRYGVAVGLVLGYLLWGIDAAFVVIYPPKNFLISVLVYGMPLILLAYAIVRRLGDDSIKLVRFPMNVKHIVLRSLIGGTVIVTIAVLATVIGNEWGGIFSAFPAAFTSILIIYYYLQGPQVIPAIARSLFFPGALGFIVYPAVAALTFPLYGIWLGTGLSYLATFVFFGIYYVTQKRLLSFFSNLVV